MKRKLKEIDTKKCKVASRYSKKNLLSRSKFELKIEELLKNLVEKYGNKYTFMAQYPFTEGRVSTFYIADFYLPNKSLVIEIDGSYHNNRNLYDADRDCYFHDRKMWTLRIKNSDVENLTSEKLREMIGFDYKVFDRKHVL